MRDSVEMECFTPYVGQGFPIGLAQGDATVTLIAAKAGKAIAGGGRRAPFSLTLRADSARMTEQGVYPLRHPDLGVMEIFLVPVARDGDTGTTVFQAVFN